MYTVLYFFNFSLYIMHILYCNNDINDLYIIYSKMRQLTHFNITSSLDGRIMEYLNIQPHC